MPPENFESTHKKLSPTQDVDDDEHEVEAMLKYVGDICRFVYFFTTTPQGPV